MEIRKHHVSWSSYLFNFMYMLQSTTHELAAWRYL